MSSYLTGWDSDAQIALQQIYQMQSRYKSILQTHRRSKTEEKIKSKHKDPHSKKYIIERSKMTPRMIKINDQNRQKSIMTISSICRNLTKKLNRKEHESSKIGRTKQNNKIQQYKHKFEQKTKSRKASAHLKVPVVNIFQKLDLQHVTPSRFKQIQSVNTAVYNAKEKQKANCSSKKISSIFLLKKVEQASHTNESKQNIYKQLLSYGSTIHQIPYTSPSFPKKLHKSSSDYHSRKFQHQKFHIV